MVREKGQPNRRLHHYDSCSQNRKEGPTPVPTGFSGGDGMLANSEGRMAWVVEGIYFFYHQSYS